MPKVEIQKDLLLNLFSSHLTGTASLLKMLSRAMEMVLLLVNPKSFSHPKHESYASIAQHVKSHDTLDPSFKSVK